MTFGMTTFTFVHVLLSLIGIFSGFRRRVRAARREAP